MSEVVNIKLDREPNSLPYSYHIIHELTDESDDELMDMLIRLNDKVDPYIFHLIVDFGRIGVLPTYPQGLMRRMNGQKLNTTTLNLT